MATNRQLTVFWMVAGSIVIACLLIIAVGALLWKHYYYDSYEAVATDMLPYIEAVRQYREDTGYCPPSLAKLPPAYLPEKLVKDAELYTYEYARNGEFTLTAPPRGGKEALWFRDDGAGHLGWYYDTNGWKRMAPVVVKVQPKPVRPHRPAYAPPLGTP